MFTFRSFRVAKAQRSKQFKQVVLSVHLGSFRQVAIRQVRHKRSARGRSKTSLISRLRQNAVTPATMIALGLAGVTFFGIQASLSTQLKPAKAFAVSAESLKAYSLPKSEPTHISIPSVQIDADMLSVGQDANGAIALPSVYDWKAGWYTQSPTPGEIGPSIVVGHVDNPKGISVFWNLRYVKARDIIEITRADGSVAKFRVTALKQFDQANFPTDEVYGNIKYAGLRLITCGGAFDKTTGEYTQNTVVYAQLVK